jgi:signal transduction histidine kinase
MPGGGALRVKMGREHQLAVVEVIDEGIGIPAEVLPRIFELYFTTKAKGSGIGLAMTYRILQLHGGAMDVRSTTDRSSPERGSVFTFRLPIASGVGNEGRKAVVSGAMHKESTHKEIEERV